MVARPRRRRAAHARRRRLRRDGRGEVRTSVTKFANAVVDGNPGKACDLVVKSSKAARENAMTKTILDLDDEDREALHRLKIVKVRVVGAVAQVQLRNGGEVLSDSVTLRRQKGKWRIVKA